MSDEKVDPETPILLAESDPAVLDSLGTHLEEFQLRCVEIADEAHGVMRLEDATQFTLILLGSSLAGMSSLKMLAALRASGTNSETPILYLYGSDEAALSERATAAGAAIALEKPVEEESLRAAIESLLGKRIVSKTEEARLSLQHVEAATQAVEEVKNLRAKGDFDGAEDACWEALIQLFVRAASAYRAKEDKKHTEIILEVGENLFPEVRERFEERTEAAPEKKKAAGGKVPGPADRVSPHLPVLLAERDREALASVGGFFEEFQLENVTVVKNGFDVLSADDSTQFGLIFLGSKLTDMSPLKVVAALRNSGEKNSETPIVFLHGLKEDSLAKEVAAAGASAALPKPVKPDALQDVIEKLLGKQIVLRFEEGAHSARLEESLSRTVGAFKELRGAGVFLRAEAAFVDVLLELIFSAVELYLSRGNQKRAEQILDNAKSLFIDVHEKFKERRILFEQRGSEFLAGEKSREAKVEFDALVTLDDQNVEGWIKLGESCLGMEDAEGAKRSFGRAVTCEKNPDNPKVLNRLGMLACRIRYYDIALAAYDRLLSVFQLDPKLFYNKSLVFVSQREFDKAVVLLNRALLLDSDFSEAEVLLNKVKIWMKEIG